MKKPNLTPDEIQDLNEMAKNGQLWGVEISYTSGQETKRLYYHNRTNAQVMEIRRNLFTIGFVVPIGDKTFRVVSPFDILDVILCKQDSYISHS